MSNELDNPQGYQRLDDDIAICWQRVGRRLRIQ